MEILTILQDQRGTLVHVENDGVKMDGITRLIISTPMANETDSGGDKSLLHFT